MGDSPDFLPKGWIMETRPKQNGTTYKVYIAPSSGLKFQSKKKVFEYLNNEELSKRSSSSKSGAASKLARKTEESPDYLPKGWIVETRPKQNGDTYKRYIAPSGQKFNARKKVFEFLNIEDPSNSSRSSERGSDVSTSQATTPCKDTGDALPAGWVSGVKVRKSDKSRKDSYYIDPVTGYIFHSRKDVFRYLATGEIGIHASKPYNGVSDTIQLTDEDDSPSNTAKRRKVEDSTVTRCLFTGQSTNEMTVDNNQMQDPPAIKEEPTSNEMTVDSNQMQDPPAIKEEPISNHASVQETVSPDNSKKGRVLRSGKTLDTVLPAPGISADSNDSKKGQMLRSGKTHVTASLDDSKKGRMLRSGKTFVATLPASEISPDSDDSEKGKLLCSGQTLGTALPAPEISPDSDDSEKGGLLCSSGKTLGKALPAPEISPDSDDSKKGQLLCSGQTPDTAIPAPEIPPDSDDSKKGRLLRSGKTHGTALPAPKISPDSNDLNKGRLLRCGKTLGTASLAQENSPKKQLKEIKGGVGKRQNKRNRVKTSKTKEESGSPLRASKRLSGVEVEPMLDLEVGSRKSVVASVREVTGGKATNSNHQVLEPVDQIGSALEPKTAIRGRESRILMECEKANHKDGDTKKTHELVEPKILTRGMESGGLQCEKARYKDGDTEKTNELEDQIGSLEPKFVTRGKVGGAENTSHKFVTSGEVRLERENTSRKVGGAEMIDGLVRRIGSASEQKSLTSGKISGKVQLDCQRTNHIDGNTENTHELVNGIGFALEPKTITEGVDSGEVQLECEKAIRTDRVTEKISEKPACLMDLPFGDIWRDPCLEFAVKTLIGETKILSGGKENGETLLECKQEIHKDRRVEKTIEKQECSMNLPFGDSWPDPCLEFAFKTLTGDPQILPNESGEVELECGKAIHQNRDMKKINEKPECSMSLPFEDIWRDPCLEFAFKTLTGDSKTISAGKGSGEDKLECEKAIGKDKDTEKTNGKPECSMNSLFGNSWPDPCLEFAFETLTRGSKPIISTGSGSVEVQSECEKATCTARDMEKTKEKPECSLNLPFGDSWPDPCLEFAFKTLTGDFPMEGDLTIQDYFHPSQTPNARDNGVNGSCQIGNQLRFDPPEKSASQLQLQKNPGFSAQGNANRLTYGAKNGFQQKHIAGSGQNSR
ncbi:methyl-CpG-binding domain-containing protein 13-like isoform X2 [Papaver somniferum]|uniref:methyl-CpG-binding domain-containing protein 13-like isoform X2 n=1 Tax=Papaver somniferum TaxID=3469 RepID=UPI000E6FA90F|nr:methyl-CpG-binding domain-containing protein 13-like isoform X2 [Papaver somniferum]